MLAAITTLENIPREKQQQAENNLVIIGRTIRYLQVAIDDGYGITSRMIIDNNFKSILKIAGPLVDATCSAFRRLIYDEPTQQVERSRTEGERLHILDMARSLEVKPEASDIEFTTEFLDSLTKTVRSLQRITNDEVEAPFYVLNGAKGITISSQHRRRYRPGICWIPDFMNLPDQQRRRYIEMHQGQVHITAEGRQRIATSIDTLAQPRVFEAHTHPPNWLPGGRASLSSPSNVHSDFNDVQTMRDGRAWVLNTNGIFEQEMGRTFTHHSLAEQLQDLMMGVLVVNPPTNPPNLLRFAMGFHTSDGIRMLQFEWNTESRSTPRCVSTSDFQIPANEHLTQTNILATYDRLKSEHHDN